MVEHRALPEVWRVVSSKKGKLYAEESFTSRKEADAFVKAEPVDMFGEPNHYQVVKDTPELRVRIEGIPIHEPIDVAMRETWIARNEGRLKPIRPQARPTKALTRTPARVGDPLGFRYGGRAPLRTKEDWPRCGSCRKAISFVGTLDFRGDPLRTRLPGDALAYFQCQNCLQGARIDWLMDGDPLVLVSAPKGVERAPEQTLEPWTVLDFPCDPEYFLPVSPDEEFVLGRGAYMTATVYGCKIGGHLFWIQKDETPECACRKPMSFLGQFTGDGEQLGFGDSGIAYLFFCPARRCPSGWVIQTF